MTNNRHDIIHFDDILSRISWEPIEETPVDETNQSWLWTMEWNRRCADMAVKNDNGPERFKMIGGDDLCLLINPLRPPTQQLQVVWRAQSLDRHFIADKKPVTLIDQIDPEGRSVTTITVTPDGAAGDLAGSWPLAMCDDAALTAVAQAAAEWAASQGRKKRYNSGTRTSDGGFFPMIPQYRGIITSTDEWKALTSDLRSWATLMREAQEGGHDTTNLRGDAISHAEDLADW